MCNFFFQAEDGIRDYKVTGVQTCALPISSVFPCSKRGQNIDRAIFAISRQSIPAASAAPIMLPTLVPATTAGLRPKIGRASCRERGQMSEVDRELQGKHKAAQSGVGTHRN